jgi:DNA-binding transcriptional LysR family regulator
MPEQTFAKLRGHLLESGVSPRHVKRTIAELEDHFDDLLLEARSNGLSPTAAATFAQARIGEHELIARNILARTELKRWIYRYPRVARVYLPLAYLLLLPAAPVFAGAENASVIARWGTSVMVSAAVTATMLLLMQIAITLT